MFPGLPPRRPEAITGRAVFSGELKIFKGRVFRRRQELPDNRGSGGESQGEAVYRIDEKTGMPLYLQLKEIIRRQIEEEIYHPGEKLPTEDEYCQQFSVSRITVRQAISKLVEEKLIIRKQGKGTYVAPVKLRRILPRLYSFSEDILASGMVPDSVVLEKVLVQADPETAEILRLPPGNPRIYRVTRIRRANQEPMLLETACFPAGLCPGLEKRDLELHSLYQILREEYGLKISYAEEQYEVTSLDQEKAELLRQVPRTPAFSIQRVAYLPGDVPVEFTRAWSAGNSMSFSLTLVPETRFRRTIGPAAVSH